MWCDRVKKLMLAAPLQGGAWQTDDEREPHQRGQVAAAGSVAAQDLATRRMAARGEFGPRPDLAGDRQPRVRTRLVEQVQDLRESRPLPLRPAHAPAPVGKGLASQMADRRQAGLRELLARFGGHLAAAMFRVGIVRQPQLLPADLAQPLAREGIVRILDRPGGRDLRVAPAELVPGPNEARQLRPRLLLLDQAQAEGRLIDAAEAAAQLGGDLLGRAAFVVAADQLELVGREELPADAAQELEAASHRDRGPPQKLADLVEVHAGAAPPHGLPLFAPRPGSSARH